MLHIKLNGKMYILLGQVEKSNIKSVQISLFLLIQRQKRVDKLLYMIYMMPKVN